MPNNIGPKAAVVFDLHSLKYPITVTNNRTNNHFNINFFRYAHVLLAYAECKARIGEVDQSAYNAINVIRRRANKLPISEVSAFDLQQGLTPQQFVDSVIAERRWELCAEPVV